MLQLLGRNRDYRNLWLGQTVSLLGDGIRNWSMIYWVFQESGESPLIQAISMVAALAPTVVLGPLAGVLVDRWDRKRTMVIADAVRGFLSLAMLPALLTGQIWLMLLLVFLGSCVAQFFDPARSAMVPRVVGQDQLVVASSLGQMTRTLLQLAEPALGTVIYLFLGPVLAFSLDAVTFFLSALFIGLVRTSGAVQANGQTGGAFWADFKAGLAYCWNQPFIRAIIIGLSVLFMGGGATNTLQIFVVKGVGAGEESLALVGTVQALATLLMSMLLSAASKRIKRYAMLIPAGIGFVSGGIICSALATHLYWVIGGAVCFGLGMALVNMGASITIQLLVPNELMGRVSGALMPIPMSMMLLSAGAAGALGEQVGYGPVLSGAAVLALLSALVTFIGLRGVQVTPHSQTTSAA